MNDIQTAILNSLARRDWRLVRPDQDAFGWPAFVASVRQILAESSSLHGPESQHLDRVVIAAYCPILHTACKDEGTLRQHRAFEELWTWVYRRVYPRVNDAQITEDLTQEVLLKVYRSLDQVTDPRGFLAYVNRIAFNHVSDHYSRSQKQLDTTALSLTNSGEGEDASIPDDLGRMAASEKEISAALAEVEALIYSCMPRSTPRQTRVLIELALHKRSTFEVSELLGITPNYVYVLFSRRAKVNFAKHCADTFGLASHLSGPDLAAARGEP